MKKRLNNDVLTKVNKNENQFQKIDENFDKEKWQLKNNILYANKRIYISSEKLRNALFKQNHDDFYAEHFEYEKIFELIRRKYWWLKLTRNVKEYFKFCTDCHRIKFTKHKLYDFHEFLSMFKNSRQEWTLDFIIDLFSCRFLNEVYIDILIIVNRFTKYFIYVSVWKDWKVENFANVLTNNVFKYFDILVSIVSDKTSLFISHF